MTSVATFELVPTLEQFTLKNRVSQYWRGQGYEVDICSWWASTPSNGRLLCVLEYFYNGNVHELDMLTKVAMCLLEVSEDRLFYYRCVDFVGDLDIPNQQNRKGGYFKGSLKASELIYPEYAPSMNSTDIYLIVS